MLGGPQSRYGCCGEIFWPYRCSNSELSFVQPVSSLYRLCCPSSLTCLQLYLLQSLSVYTVTAVARHGVLISWGRSSHLSAGSPCTYWQFLLGYRQNQQNGQTPRPESANELYRPSERRLSENVMPKFADRGCRVVSAKGYLRPYCRFSRPELLPFLSSRSSILFTRLSRPRSRPTTS
jgi:hypothetical protein